MKKFFKILSLMIIVTSALLWAAPSGSSVNALDEETAAWVEEARAALQEVLQEKTVMALVYLSDEYPIRAEASYESAAVKTVLSGQQVQIQDVTVDDAYEVWVYVIFYYQEGQYYGYIPRTYLACSDQDYLEWEILYGMNPAARMPLEADSAGQTIYPDIEAFPESYREALLALKKAHPKWTFVKMKTGLDWNSAIENEMKGGKSLVPNSFPEYMKEGVYGAGWSYAAPNILEYYMDPRNGLAENTIFQFEQLTYNPDYHTEESVQTFLNGTFMAGRGPGTDLTFAKIFWANGMDLGVSPFHLACRVYQEQGQGKSPLISGTYKGFEGYYNYFNIKASGKTETEIIVNGLNYAKAQNPPWKDAYYSIRSGAIFISQDYILKGQDTLYLQKFNVNPNGTHAVYTHQYMQNICAPNSEGKNMKKLYTQAGSLENTFIFSIPVFENMPAAASPYPSKSLDVTVEPPQGYTDTTVWLDGVAYPAASRNGKLVVAAPNEAVQTAVMYKYSASGVPAGMYVWSLSYGNGVYTATAVPELTDLMTYHGFSIRITGKSGIRFKTGVSAALRTQLQGGGAGGFTLKEYGTLIMNNANRNTYPMVKGGEKVLGGMSYGYNSSGKLEDIIYETVDGRYRYTSVLVGLPANQYKTEYAFRGYMVLQKNGKEVTLYGPVVARSIYGLAEQVLAIGQYPAGSAAELFLKQLIADAG